MKIELDINNELLISYAERSTVGWTHPVDEDGNEVEMTDEEIASSKVEFALADITSKVKHIVVRPAEIDLKKAKQEELKHAVEAVEAQVEFGATITPVE